MGVAGEIGENRLGPGERRLGIDEPVLPAEWREVSGKGLATVQAFDSSAVNNGAANPIAVAEPSDSTLTARNQHSIEPTVTGRAEDARGSVVSAGRPTRRAATLSPRRSETRTGCARTRPRPADRRQVAISRLHCRRRTSRSSPPCRRSRAGPGCASPQPRWRSSSRRADWPDIHHDPSFMGSEQRAPRVTEGVARRLIFEPG